MLTLIEMFKIVKENQSYILEQDLKDGAPLGYYDAERRFVIRYPDGTVEYHEKACLPNLEHCHA